MVSTYITVAIFLLSAIAVKACSNYSPNGEITTVPAGYYLSTGIECDRKWNGFISITSRTDSTLTIYTTDQEGYDIYRLTHRMESYFISATAINVLNFKSPYIRFNSTAIYIIVKCNNLILPCPYADYSMLTPGTYYYPIFNIPPISPTIIAWYFILLIALSGVAIITGVIFGIVKICRYFGRKSTQAFEMLTSEPELV